MEGDPKTLAAMADSLKVSDPGGHPDGQSTRMQDEDCFYDCEETFHAERTSPAINQTEMTHSEGTVNGLQTESNRNPDTGEESAQASNPFEGNAATRGHEPPEKDGVLGEEEYERIEEEDERKKDTDSEFKEEATKPSEYDDEYLREAEKNLTEEEKESRKVESMALKEKGNAQFKNREYVEAQKSYTDALAVCPVCYSKQRSILFSNRAAARMHLEEKTDAISDCTKAIELNPDYVRAILRRAELYEQTEKLDEALEDYKTVLEKDPGIPAAREACGRLPRQIEERNEKLKEEMLGKLKDLGNMILRPFGLSTANFQVKQDDNTGSYSVNFVQNPNNNNR
ncbi:tetratricopeptide repeat protein 1 [Neoarius graeffei]|uniref:tetratricopeptide repeat protein 1 n=1 Tax=Neoarius graeffei TaxID=443677 RepID=UPI00298C61FA|nr:tetratricopeptide repeat protein 1 [Neoarius graeffei]